MADVKSELQSVRRDLERLNSLVKSHQNVDVGYEEGIIIGMSIGHITTKQGFLEQALQVSSEGDL